MMTFRQPFLDKYPVNSSWSVASTLPAIIPATAAHPDPIRIIVHPWPVRVSYQSVEDLIPKLFRPFDPKPDAILHIGLAAGRKYFAMEHGAYRSIYDKNKDVDGHTFSVERSRRQWSDLPEYLETGFDTDELWKRWRRELTDPDIDIRRSADPGNYLCGFIYYSMLAKYMRAGQGDRPVMFLHVPDLPEPKDVARGREAAKTLIRAMVDCKRARRDSASEDD